jgi:hypothetical protein
LVTRVPERPQAVDEAEEAAEKVHDERRAPGPKERPYLIGPPIRSSITWPPARSVAEVVERDQDDPNSRWNEESR